MYQLVYGGAEGTIFQLFIDLFLSMGRVLLHTVGGHVNEFGEGN